ncbi:hypothetical protein NE237_032098 [Protea cynaroides]|uniref:Uncharacterized protein n=1 Tax=Protea cynaroides TaxID=273540 RepID=A0A9Q0L3Q8_9MAGN|nr:hypothetical protein NE237_032098 [Protea cynaroides]
MQWKKKKQRSPICESKRRDIKREKRREMAGDGEKVGMGLCSRVASKMALCFRSVAFLMSPSTREHSVQRFRGRQSVDEAKQDKVPEWPNFESGREWRLSATVRNAL